MKDEEIHSVMMIVSVMSGGNVIRENAFLSPDSPNAGLGAFRQHHPPELFFQDEPIKRCLIHHQNYSHQHEYVWLLRSQREIKIY
jgi:hypothetical protein